MGQSVTLTIPGPNGVDVLAGTAASPLIVTSGSSTTPSVVGGEYNSTLPALTTGQTDALQLTSTGELRVQLVGWVAASASGTSNSLAFVGSGAGNVATARNLLAEAGFQYNGTTWDQDRKPNQTSRIVSSAATTNATVAKATAGDLFRVSGYNSNAAARYLKIYNKATAPVVGTDVPIWTEYLAPQAKFDLAFPKGLYFSAGISYALVTGAADADATAVAAGDILALNLAYA